MELNIRYFVMWLINAIISYLPPLIVFTLIAFLIIKFIKKGNVTETATLPVPIFLYFIAMYSLITVANIINHWGANVLDHFFGTGELRDIFGAVMPENLNQWLTLLLFAGIVAPIAEELIYRHILLKPLRCLNDRWAVIITALLFGALHGNRTQFLYAVVGGIILGIAAVRANSIKPAIIIHMLNNSFDIGKSFMFELIEEDSFGHIVLMNSYVLLIFAGLVTAAILMAKRGFSLPPKLLSSETPQPPTPS